MSKAQLKPSGVLTKAIAKAKRERWEDMFLSQLRGCPGIPMWHREWQFDSKRKWRFDFALVTLLVVAEIEGGVYSQGRHTRGSGFEADCEKYNRAAELGWTIFRYTPSMVKSGDAIAQFERVVQEKLAALEVW